MFDIVAYFDGIFCPNGEESLNILFLSPDPDPEPRVQYLLCKNIKIGPIVFALHIRTYRQTHKQTLMHCISDGVKCSTWEEDVQCDPDVE